MPQGAVRFEPVLEEKVWGGRRLESALGRTLPEGARIGESWEISGFRGRLTKIARGPRKGLDVYALARDDGESIFGEAVIGACLRDFPLLVKLIDASDVLSVQVHPDEELARRTGRGRGKPARGVAGKSEAWVVVDARPGAFLYAGLKPGKGLEDVRAALESGDRDAFAGCMGRIEVKPGDVIDLPAGTIHAAGSGLLLYEVQESSDTTFRLYDWGRMGLDGKPRELHVRDGLEALKPFVKTGPEVPEAISVNNGTRSVFKDAPPFHLEELVLEGPAELDMPGGRFEILTVLKGRGALVAPGGAEGEREEAFSPGETLLLPASWGAYEIRPEEKAECVRSWPL